MRPRARRPLRGRGRGNAGISDSDLPRRGRSDRSGGETDSQTMVEDRGSRIKDRVIEQRLMATTALNNAMIELSNDNAVISIENLANGRRKVSVHPMDEKFFAPISSFETKY